MTFQGFPKQTIEFLSALAKNNNRDWFAANKQSYENYFIAPSLAYIEAMRRPMEKFAPLLKAEPKKMGGSLMRIYKDTRFSKDKTPYKTNIGIQFRHQAGKDIHAPGFYLHIAPDEIFFGAGMWRPDAAALKSIRNFIDTNPTAWKRGFHSKKFRDAYQIYDDSLKSSPRGFAKDHVNSDDLRLKSYIGMAPLSRKQLESETFVGTTSELMRSAKPMMTTLCEAIEQPY